MSQAPAAVPFAEAFRFWLKLGFISFGGPAGQIAIMHRELVEQKRWISEQRFLHALNYCMLLPGPEAQQLATYIGWLMHRTAGGIVAGALFVLPSLFILVALSWVYLVFGDVAWVAGLFYGIKPAVAAIVLHAVYRIGSRTLKTPRQVPLLWTISVLSFVAIAVLHVPFPAVVLGAALAGWLGGRFLPGQFAAGGGHGGAAASYGPALIDDDTPTPRHALFTRARLARVLAAVVVTWFTFLPSFIFILAGGPLIESTHGRLGFTAPLTAITAAVVGVIASLAVFFIGHIARRADGRIDLAALALVALAALALFRFKLGVIPVIAGCAVAGLLLRLAGLA